MRRTALLLAILVSLAVPGPSAGQPVSGFPIPPAGEDAAPDAWILSGGDVGGAAAWLATADIPHHVLPNLGMVTFLASPEAARAVQAEHGGDVERREMLPLHLDKSVAAIEADAVKERLGLVRNGPTVMVVDTGIDSAHPDFQDTLVANVQPEVQGGLIVGTLDQRPVFDTAGHGTHVGGIVAGTGAAFGSGDDLNGRYAGVYSVGRVASYQVSAPVSTDGEPQVDTVAALEAFEWTLQNRKAYDIRVITNSWGASGPFKPDAAVNKATLALYKAGVTVVFSAGNEGKADTLNKYCMAPWVLCVAAADNGRSRASFSSWGDASVPYKHPDLSAPGLHIMSAHPVGRSGMRIPLSQPSGTLYSDRSGTSMAAPHAAATAGLVLAANPALSPDQVMDILVHTTEPMADPVDRVGTGFLNARKAFNTAVATVGNLDAFLAGQEVKYAGPETGDDLYAHDPVSIGFDAQTVPAPLIPGRGQELWILTSPVAWVLVAAAGIAVLLGVQWRRPRPSPPAGPAHRVTPVSPQRRIVSASRSPGAAARQPPRRPQAQGVGRQGHRS